MLDKNTRVVVRGFDNPLDNNIDYEQECTLGESLDVIRSKLLEDSVKNNEIYLFSVAIDMFDVVYTYYDNKVVIADNYKGKIILD